MVLYLFSICLINIVIEIRELDNILLKTGMKKLLFHSYILLSGTCYTSFTPERKIVLFRSKRSS